MRSAVASVTGKLGGIVSAAWDGLRNGVKPVLNWFTSTLPRAFGRVKDAAVRVLRGIGGFVGTGMQAVVSVIKGPLNGLIGFANWVIGGLDKLSFSVLGKKFGIHLPKIPMLAEGGVALPGAGGRAGRVLPLDALGAGGPAPRRAGSRVRLSAYHESAARGPRGTAEDLLLLTAAYA